MRKIIVVKRIIDVRFLKPDRFFMINFDFEDDFYDLKKLRPCPSDLAFRIGARLTKRLHLVDETCRFDDDDDNIDDDDNHNRRTRFLGYSPIRPIHL